MAIIKQYHWVIGLILLAFVTIAMLGNQDTFRGKNVFLYTNLSNPTSEQTFVRTTMEFGDQERLQEFPKQIGDWQGSDYNVDGLEEQLGADVMLMRAYTKPGLYQPIFFLIMQSESKSSFHPPEVCYPAAGWEITEEEKDAIAVPNAFWAKEPLYPELEARIGDTSTSLSVKRLVVTKGTDGEIEERRVVLYFYVKHATIGAGADEVTMIRISAIAPTEGSYESILDFEKGLLIDFFPHMFELQEEEDLIIVQLAKWGIGGVLLLLVAFSAPFGLIFYPQIWRFIRRQ